MKTETTRRLRGAWAMMTALVLLLSAAGCGTDGYTITSINDDGTFTVTDANGAAYRYATVTEEQEPAKTIDVTVFGAKGDGVTDDTEAFRNAFLVLQSGDSLYIPEGTYPVADGFTVSGENVRIYGEPQKTEIVFARRQETDDTAGFLYIGSTAANVTVEGLVLTGTDTSAGGSGICISGSRDIAVRDITASGFGYAGILVTGAGDAYAEQIRIEGCTLTGNRTAGIVCGNADGLAVCGNTFRANGTGLTTADGSVPKHLRVIGNHVSGNYTGGIRITAGETMDLSENILSANHGFGIDARGDSLSGVSITSNNFNTMSADDPAETMFAVAVGGNGDFTVSNNMVLDFDAADGSGVPILADVTDGSVAIIENTIQCITADGIILSGGESSAVVVCSSNAVSAETLRGEAIHLAGAGLTLANNVLKFVSDAGKAVITFDGTAGAAVLASGNLAETTGQADFAAFDAAVVKTDANFLNGNRIS